MFNIGRRRKNYRVNWCFLHAALLQIGFPTTYVDKIKALFTIPMARVNGHLLNPFVIKNEKRQGFPLSPNVYILAMEYLERAIHQNPTIQCINNGEHTHKIGLFTNTLLIY